MHEDGPAGMAFPLIMLLMAIILASAGQVLLKAGLSQLDHPTILQIMLSMFRNITVFAGYAAFVLSSLLWLVAIQRLPLSYAYPMVSLGYVAVAILSWKIFGETIPPLRLVALGVILTGVVLMALSHVPKHAEPGSAPAAAVQTLDHEAGPS
jgi:multidrug transporter EmrE-like cation transporter